MSEEPQSTLELPNLKKQVKLRIEILFKNNKRQFTKKVFSKNPIQGSPLKIYLRVTNISKSICKGAKVSFAEFESKAHNIRTAISHDVQIKSLNPAEQEVTELDVNTFNLDGSYWFSCNVIPESEDQEILTFQYDDNHNKDEYYDLNKWGASIFVEGKLSSLQATTNKYILILTAITVIEAVFGLKNMIKFFLVLISKIFSLLGEFFSYVSSLT